MKQKLKTYNDQSYLSFLLLFHSPILSMKSIISIHPTTIYPVVSFAVADSVAAPDSDAVLPDESPAIH